MHLKVLGTRGEIPERKNRYSKQSGVLVDEVLLLDLGEQSYLNYKPKWILITHLHPDHAFFIRSSNEEKLKTKAKIFAPEGSIEGIQTITKEKKLGPYTIVPIPTHHSKYVKSRAYLIKKNQKCILYTGDLIWIDKKYHHLFKKIDLVITEASFIREGGFIRKDKKSDLLFGHNGVPNLIRFFRPFTRQIMFIHFGSWYIKNPIAGRKKMLALAKEYQIKIIVAYDGFEFML